MSKAANPNKPKKQETEADVAAKKQQADRERIRRALITLGDENKKVVSQVKAVVAAVEDDVELHGELLCNTVLACVKCLPTKLSMYAAWLAKMAEQHPKFAADVVAHAVDELRAAVLDCKMGSTQLLLRFFVFLANTSVLGVAAVLNLLHEVLSLSEGLKPSKGGDFGVFMALAQLPFLSQEAYQQGKAKVHSLMAAAQRYLASRGAHWKPLLQLWKGDRPDRLEELFAAVQQQQKDNWSLKVVLHVPGFRPSADGMAEMPAIALGISREEFRKSRKLQVPLMSFHLLTDPSEEVPMPTKDRWVLEDYILLTVEMFAKDVDECSKQILRIPVLHPHFEAITVETLFSEMFRLPATAFLPLFYYRLLEACAAKQASMKQLIDQAFQALIHKVQDMDEECMYALAEAFACHVANNNFKADWKVFTENEVNPKVKRFARRALERLQRLSDYPNMLVRLPQAMRIYASAEPLPASGLPVVSKPQFGRLINLVRLKDANADLVVQYCQWLMKSDTKEPEAPASSATEAPEEPKEEAEPAAKRQKLAEASKKEVLERFGDPPAQPLTLQEVAELVMSVMLQQGHKTPTHMAKILDGHEQVLRQLKPEESDAGYCRTLAKCVFDFWQAHGQRLETTIDSLVQRKVITPLAAAEVALAPGQADAMHVWNVVDNVARKSLDRSQVARADLATAKKLGKEDALAKCRAELDSAVQESASLFTSIFTSLVQKYEDASKDATLQGIFLQRIIAIGRKHLSDIKPLVDAAEPDAETVGLLEPSDESAGPEFHA
ncbi:unnamed protein product [Effrenium voratum]|nr:unnamed protein product [Effrenium voratum]